MINSEDRIVLAEVVANAVRDMDTAIVLRTPDARRAALRALFDANISWVRRRALTEAAIELLASVQIVGRDD